jgi:beta-RFAP synthase
MTVRVVAPCRLHFGLLHVPVPGLTHWPDGAPVRKFGGLGLMVTAPQITVQVSRVHKTEDDVSGSLADRARTYVERLRHDGSIHWQTGIHLSANGPPEHIGLGVGTALGLAVARAIFGGPHSVKSSADLSRRIGRGLRSGIGLHGFDRGGFLFDGGKLADDDSPALVTREPFPDAWRVALIRPSMVSDWHGGRERTAFSRRRDPGLAREITKRLMELTQREILPSVKAADFFAFTKAICDYNRLAGEPFKEEQGGPYVGPQVSELIETLRSWGIEGVGQSSWGPTVFAFAEDEERAADLAARVGERFDNLTDVTVSRACNHGAILFSSDRQPN